MPQSQKLYPRSTIKRIIKAHAGRNLGKDVDILVRILQSLNFPLHTFVAVTIADLVTYPYRYFLTTLCSSKSEFASLLHSCFPLTCKNWKKYRLNNEQQFDT